MESLRREDLQENIAIIKINKSYNNSLSALELYDITRGCWKRKLESVQDTEVVLAVAFSEVKEVYSVNSWMPASELNRETIPFDAELEKGRIGFSGQVAPDEIRNKYIGKSVADLYKRGEADPVKVFMNGCGSVNIYRFLDAGDKPAFKSIYEAINECMGTELKGWMKACWPNVMGNGKFRLWFIKLAPIVNGKPKPAANHCLNTLENDGEYVVFDDLKNSATEDTEKYTGLDMIFAKAPNEDYVFMGVYRYDKERSFLNHSVSRRLSKKVKLIGSPVEDIEVVE